MYICFYDFITSRLWRDALEQSTIEGMVTSVAIGGFVTDRYLAFLIRSVDRGRGTSRNTQFLGERSLMIGNVLRDTRCSTWISEARNTDRLARKRDRALFEPDNVFDRRFFTIYGRRCREFGTIVWCLLLREQRMTIRTNGSNHDTGRAVAVRWSQHYGSITMRLLF